MVQVSAIVGWLDMAKQPPQVGVSIESDGGGVCLAQAVAPRYASGRILLLSCLLLAMAHMHDLVLESDAEGGEGAERAKMVKNEESSSSSLSGGDGHRLLDVGRSNRHASIAREMRETGKGRSVLVDVTILNTTVVTGAKRVLRHEPQAPFIPTPTSWCGSTVRNVVLRGNDQRLYYVLDEQCVPKPKGSQITHWRLSYWMADLHAPINGSAETQRLSYWWFASDSSLSGVTAAINYSDPSRPEMAFVNGMDFDEVREQIILSTSTGRKSTLVFLSPTTYERSSRLTSVNQMTSLALDANRSSLYAADAYRPSRLVDTPWPLKNNSDVEFRQLNVFTKGAAGHKNISDVSFGPQSWDPEGKCLYFLDNEFARVWAVEPVPNAQPAFVAGSGMEAHEDGDAVTASFDTPRELVVTPDGCNLFLTERNGYLRWISLSSACGIARRVSTLAFSGGIGYRGLALHDSGTRKVLYVGSNDGDIFELEINSTRLSTCSTPPASFPPPSKPSPSEYILSFPAISSQEVVPLSTSSSPPPSSPRSSASTAIVVVASVISVLIFALVAGLLLFLYCRRRRPRKTQTSSTLLATSNMELTVGAETPNGRGFRPTSVRAFPLAALSHCTRDFSQIYRIGERGAFGEVYWGELESREVAIKVMVGELTAVKRKQFLAEINTLSRVHHANLVELIGYCQEGARSILVYPFFPGGCLHSRLHNASATPGKPALPPLTLRQRMAVAWQVAEGLRYLHQGADPPVIHRDVKSSNVLLRDDPGGRVRAVVADFGLATIVENVFQTPHDVLVKTSHIAGTHGYMAPEYMLRGMLSVKTDVYAFGVILLELMTGRKPVAQAATEGGGWQTLVMWVKSFSHGPFADLPGMALDPWLQDNCKANLAARSMVSEMFWLGMDCVHEDDARRPTMSAAAERIATIISQGTKRTV